MPNKKKQIHIIFKGLNIIKTYALSLLLVLCISCVTTVKETEYPVDSRIMAENSSIKKRLPLIERENDVLRKENHQHRATIVALETQIKNLGLELAFLGEKYDNDMTKNQIQINDLELTIQEIEKESAQRINSLTYSKVVLEKKLTRKIQSLNKNIVSQRENFQKEREKIVKANAKRESELNDRIDVLKKTVETKNKENETFKSTNAEISGKLKEAINQAEALKKSRDESLAELETVKATNARLTKALNSQ